MGALVRNAAERVARAGVPEQDATTTPTTTLAEAADAAEARFRASPEGGSEGRRTES